jgi:hypothetical protein
MNRVHLLFASLLGLVAAAGLIACEAEDCVFLDCPNSITFVLEGANDGRLPPSTVRIILELGTREYRTSCIIRDGYSDCDPVVGPDGPFELEATVFKGKIEIDVSTYFGNDLPDEYEITAVAGDAPPLEASGSPDYYSVTTNGELCGADCRIGETQEFTLPTL